MAKRAISAWQVSSWDLADTPPRKSYCSESQLGIGGARGWEGAKHKPNRKGQERGCQAQKHVTLDPPVQYV